MKYEEWLKNHPLIKQAINLKEEEIEWDIDSYTHYLMRLKIQNEPTFSRCFKKQYNISKLFYERLFKKAHGIQPDSYIIFIRGLTGVDTGMGIKKSSTAIQIMRMFDETPSVKKIYFSNDELIQGIQEWTKQHGIKQHNTFIRDETPESLRHRSQIEFNTMRESSRKARCSMILVKPEIENLHAATFVLEPCATSKKDHIVKLAVYVPDVGYIGYALLFLEWNNNTWKEYEPYKDHYIETALARQTNQFQYDDYATKFLQGLYATKIFNPSGKINTLRLRKYVRHQWSNLTNEEVKIVCDSVKEIIQEKQEDET